MKTTIYITLLAVALLLSAACQPAADSAASIDLAGTNWILSSLGGQPPLADTAMTLEFGDDGTVTGSDGCNRFNTTYTQNGAELTVAQPAASTMIACDEPVTAQASAFQQALATVETFAATEQELVLVDGDGNELAAFTVVSQALGGTSWRVTNYNNGNEAVVGVIDGTELTVSFGDDGQVNGTAGCNNFFAAYEAEAEAGTIAISEIGSAMMACEEPEGIMAQEQAFLAALTTAATYRIQGNTLELRTADDALAVMMQRAQ
jgi:heat shock protein HslJ